MPDPYERHAKTTSWGGGSAPPRSQQRAAAADDDPVHSSVPSSARRGACKGPGGWREEHAFIFRKALDVQGREKGDCHWGAVRSWPARVATYVPGWVCNHVQECRRCKQVSRPFDIGQDCPDYEGQPVPPELVAECEKSTAEAEERWLAWQAARARPPVTGKRGYRKPRAAKKGEGT